MTPIIPPRLNQRFLRHHVEPWLLFFEGARGRLAIVNRITGMYFHLRCRTVPMITYPRFGFRPLVHASGGIGCSAATVDEAIDKLKLFFHANYLLADPGHLTVRILLRSAAVLSLQGRCRFSLDKRRAVALEVRYRI